MTEGERQLKFKSMGNAFNFNYMTFTDEAEINGLSGLIELGIQVFPNSFNDHLSLLTEIKIDYSIFNKNR